jgi:hypothetical protein
MLHLDVVGEFVGARRPDGILALAAWDASAAAVGRVAAADRRAGAGGNGRFAAGQATRRAGNHRPPANTPGPIARGQIQAD